MCDILKRDGNNIVRRDGSGEHAVLFTKEDSGTITAHMRHKMSYDDRQALMKAVPGVAYCFDRCGEYASEITIAETYCDGEVVIKVSKWLASWLRRNHPQTVMHKICAACCPCGFKH